MNPCIHPSLLSVHPFLLPRYSSTDLRLEVVLTFTANAASGSSGCSSGASDGLAIAGGVMDLIGLIFEPAAFIGALCDTASAVCGATK